MRITNLLSTEATLAELGERVRRERLYQDITQASLATEAGISTPTLQRLESGASVQLKSLIRVLNALGLQGHLNALLSAPDLRPMALLVRDGNPRQRASRSGEPADETPWTWGD